MSRWAIALLASCSAPAAAPPLAPAPPALLTIRADSLGPLTAKVPATLVALRDALRGFVVAPLNDDGLEYRVSQDGTRLFDIVPADDGHILNVHVVTPKIDVAGRPWRVGTPFAGDVTTCECWADQTVCFTEGEHVAVALAKICREGAFDAADARKQLAGVPIRAAIWSPRPLAAGGYERAEPEED